MVKRVSILFLFMLLQTSCSGHIFKHNQKLAASSAQAFAQAVIVEKVFKKGRDLYGKLADSLALDDLQRLVERMHPSGEYPEAIRADSYEPMPGQKGIKIYLVGALNDKNFYYLIVMNGTEPEGYIPAEVYRFETGFPNPASLLPL